MASGVPTKSYWKRVFRRKKAKRRKVYLCARKPYKTRTKRSHKMVWATIIYYMTTSDGKIHPMYRILSWDIKKRPRKVMVTQNGRTRRLPFCERPAKLARQMKEKMNKKVKED